MALNRDLVGVPGEALERSWTASDALLYAVGVGAGLDDPLAELEFTTENCAGIWQRVLPTYGVLIAPTTRAPARLAPRSPPASTPAPRCCAR